MNKALDITAKVLSTLLYPLFIPTYGMMLFCYAFSRSFPIPLVWTLIAIIGTFILTCILPLTAIWIMIRRGDVTDLQINDAGERTMPYIYALLGFSFWCYLMISILHVPLYIGFVTIGASLAIGIVALINRKWKISAHLSGMGGLIGGLMIYYLGAGMMPNWGTLSICLCLSLALMYARLRLNAHTPLQVCCGWLLGISCTFIPYCIYYYVA